MSDDPRNSQAGNASGAAPGATSSPGATGTSGRSGADVRRRAALSAFFVAAALVAVASVTFETTFNNFLSDRFNMDADARGQLEFPRELPGFLVSVMTGVLFFVAELPLAIVAAALIGGGMVLLGFVGEGQYALMMVGMTMWSTGTHLMMPVQGAIALELSEPDKRATRLGQVSGVSMAAQIVGSLFVWMAMGHLGLSYRQIFIAGAAAAGAAAVAYLFVRGPKVKKPVRPKWVVRREYRLYYLLAFLFGARKQVFITFGPWVLVKIYDEPPETIAMLWFVANVLGVFFRPTLGRLIDKVGERFVLMGDALLLVFVCLGYGFGKELGAAVALGLTYACFVADNLLFAAEMARTTYLDKIALDRSDVMPTLSLGISVNHAVSMLLPTLGGFVWMKFGYQWVFFGAACVAVVTFAASSLIPASIQRRVPA